MGTRFLTNNRGCITSVDSLSALSPTLVVMCRAINICDTPSASPRGWRKTGRASPGSETSAGFSGASETLWVDARHVTLRESPRVGSKNTRRPRLQDRGAGCQGLPGFVGRGQAPGVRADAQPSAVFLMAARVLVSMSSVRRTRSASCSWVQLCSVGGSCSTSHISVTRVPDPLGSRR